MASGRPDFHPTMLLEGKHDTQLIPVLVDANGQMYIVMTGSGGLTVNLDAAGNIIARLQGYDGAALKDVKVDDAGNLISRMKGYDGANLQDVKVDDAGYMLAKMTGLYDATLKTVAVDADGIMKANLSVQDLAYLKVRPVYGQARIAATITVVSSGIGSVSLVSISGQGALLGGVIYWNAGGSSQSSMAVAIDGVNLIYASPAWFEARNLNGLKDFPIFMLVNDGVTPSYTVGIRGGTTFESSFAFSAAQESGSDITFYCYLVYALVP